MPDAGTVLEANLGAVDPSSAPGGLNLTTWRSADLLSLYDAVLRELRERGVVRSSNNPVADYAESLAAQALNLTLASRSTTGYDAVGVDGMKYEIKARRPTPFNKSRQLSVLRNLNDRHFDYLIGVLFEPTFRVERACVISAETVESLATYRTHVNGWVLHLRDGIWSRSDVRDITAELKAAQDSTR